MGSLWGRHATCMGGGLEQVRNNLLIFKFTWEKVTLLFCCLCLTDGCKGDSAPSVIGRDLRKGDPKACRSPHSSCLKVIPLCFVVCVHNIAVAAIALEYFPSKLQKTDKIQNSMKAEHFLYSLLAVKDRPPSPLMSVYPDTLLLRICFIPDR